MVALGDESGSSCLQLRNDSCVIVLDALYLVFLTVKNTLSVLRTEDDSLLRYGVMESHRIRLAFQRCVLPPSSGH
jgi:hypothetical protein